jgi:hypothetical protein
MLNAPIAKAILEMKLSARVIIWDYKYYFEIEIDSKPIAPQRMTNPPEARKFKTLAAAYSYLRTFLDYRGDVFIRLSDPTTGAITWTAC